MSQYEFFDAKIFDITRIQVGSSLSGGQKKALLDVAGEIESAYQDCGLSAADRRKLLDTIADCGLALPAEASEQTAKQRNKKRGAKGVDR